MCPRPVLAWILAALFAAGDHAAVAADPASCHAPATGEHARVASVIDGDTIVLSDATHVRLIGIDTPEIGHHGNPSEPGAIDARQFLAGLLKESDSVDLVRDAEPWDRYGRRLAHLFAGGRSVEERLLEGGYAVPLAMPPNLMFVDCYHEAVAAAQQARRGLWALPQYAPVSAEELSAEVRGYRIVRGRFGRVGHGATSTWLEFTPRFAAWIAAQDLGYFGAFDPSALIGRLVEVRGRVYAVGGQLRMRLRHPLDMDVIPESR